MRNILKYYVSAVKPWALYSRGGKHCIISVHTDGKQV